MIAIPWKCRCMASERTFDMRERDAGEDVRAWMDSLARCISTEHRRVSPLCQAVSMEYLKFRSRTVILSASHCPPGIESSSCAQ